MDAASPEKARPGEAMADVPQKPSRGHCCDGLFHRHNATFGVLYCFFVIGHDRRKILHFNVTRNPNALWVVQQLREAWAYVVSAVRDIGSQPTRTTFRSPWQNGVAERWVGSCRRDLLDLWYARIPSGSHVTEMLALISSAYVTWKAREASPADRKYPSA